MFGQGHEQKICWPGVQIEEDPVQIEAISKNMFGHGLTASLLKRQ